VATKTIKVSDLSGTEIKNEEQLARVVVEEHPELTEPITLEVLPDEVEAAIPEEQNYVRLTYYPAEASGGEPKTVMLPLEEFNNLAQSEDMATVLQNAQAQQQEQDGRRRGRRSGRRATGQRRQRIDYASPEYAGLPHRGRITNAEKEYVRNNLDEVNQRRVQQGYDPIDPADPQMASKYGLAASEPDIVEQEMQDQANL
jgi:hypothetical protein